MDNGIDLTTSDPETDEDNDFNNEDEDNDFMDHDDHSDDDDSPDGNVFYMNMRRDPTYSPKSRAPCEWDLEYRAWPLSAERSEKRVFKYLGCCEYDLCNTRLACVWRVFEVCKARVWRVLTRGSRVRRYNDYLFR